MAILLPDLADEDLTAAIDRVSGYITDATGEIREILQDSPWGRRRLAYTIRFNGTDYRDGYYAIWHFDLVPSNMGEIERELKLDTRVIRYLIVHEDPKWGSPQEREAAAAAAEAVVEAVVAEEVAEEAIVEAAAAEVVAEDAIADADVSESVVEEAVAEAVVAEAVAEEAVVEAEAAEIVAEEAVVEAVVAAEEAVAEADEESRTS